MYKDILRSIDNIEIWPIVSLGIFFLFFIALGIWLMTVDKKYINEMKNLPLDGDSAGPRNDLSKSNRN
jgi:hypothetical protein